MQDDVSRRSFLRACGAAGATVAVGEAAPGLAAPPVAAAPSWVDRPMRWAQLTLVEDDPGQFDLQFWLDYFRRTHSDAACLSAGGCVAYYPDRGPAPPPQPVPGRPRPVRRAGRAAAASWAWSCIARTDPHATYDDVHDGPSRLDRRRRRGPPAPPLGLARDVGHLRPGAVQLRVHDRGAPRDHDPLPGRRHLHQPLGRLRACATATHCRANFRAATGHDLPRTDDPQDPARRAYLLWQQRAPLRALAALGRGGPRRSTPTRA